jgi:hypothetical protein
MNRNDIHIKIKEIGDHPVALKHVAVILAFTIVALRPPMTWKTFGGAGFGASFAKKT